MIRLIPTAPLVLGLAGLLPFATGDLTCSEVEFAAITSVSPFKGQEAAVSEAMKATG